jgi:pyridoxine 5-phosphate synthase
MPSQLPYEISESHGYGHQRTNEKMKKPALRLSGFRVPHSNCNLGGWMGATCKERRLGGFLAGSLKSPLERFSIVAVKYPMLKLGVNIDHVATLREARYRGRGFGEPDPVEAARICEAAGAHGITAHLREDRRHIQDRDVSRLRQTVKRLNLEMAISPEIIEIALKLKPDIVCIVPERRMEVTTEGGLDVVVAEKSLSDLRKRMNDAGIEVSLFIAPDARQIEASGRVGSQFIELHTGRFAEEFFEKTAASPDGQKMTVTCPELERLISGAKQAHALGLGVNAGHGLNYENLPSLFAIPHLVELNIGHSIVSHSVFVGMENAVTQMLRVMEKYQT